MWRASPLEQFALLQLGVVTEVGGQAASGDSLSSDVLKTAASESLVLSPAQEAEDREEDSSLAE